MKGQKIRQVMVVEEEEKKEEEEKSENQLIIEGIRSIRLRV